MRHNSGLWLKNPWFDWTFLHIGVLLVPLFVGLRYFYDYTFTEGSYLVLLLLMGGHHVTPMLLFSADQRVRDLAQKHDAKVFRRIGLIFGASTLLFLISSALFWQAGKQTYLSYSPIAIVSLIYLLWNSYHFGAQHFGIMQLYRKHLGISSASSRTFELWMCLFIHGLLATLTWLHFGMRDAFLNFYGVQVHLTAYFPMTLAIGLGVGLVCSLWRLHANGELKTPLVLCYLQCYFVPLSVILYPTYMTYFLVIGLHNLQEIAVGSLMFSHLAPEPKQWPRRLILCFTGLIAFSVAYYALRFGLPFLADRQITSFGFIENSKALTASDFFLMCLFFGVNMGFELNHFYVGRLVYKKSNLI